MEGKANSSLWCHWKEGQLLPLSWGLERVRVSWGVCNSFCHKEIHKWISPHLPQSTAYLVLLVRSPFCGDDLSLSAERIGQHVVLAPHKLCQNGDPVLLSLSIANSLGPPCWVSRKLCLLPSVGTILLWHCPAERPPTSLSEIPLIPEHHSELLSILTGWCSCFSCCDNVLPTYFLVQLGDTPSICQHIWIQEEIQNWGFQRLTDPSTNISCWTTTGDPLKSLNVQKCSDLCHLSPVPEVCQLEV